MEEYSWITSNVNLVLSADDVFMLVEKCEDMERKLNELKKTNGT